MRGTLILAVLVACVGCASTPRELPVTEVAMLPVEGASAPVLAEEEGGGKVDMARMAQKANNPLSDVWLLITQNDYTLMEGNATSGTKKMNSLKFMPVMPVPILDDEWNLIIRPIFQLVSSPLDDDVGDLAGVGDGEIIGDTDLLDTVADPWGRTTGLGDSILLTLLGPNTDSGLIWGFGASQIFPTASEDVLGQEKWQAGPAGILARLGNGSGELDIESFNIGFLAQHWWSYAGDDDRKETNQSDIQYFLNWKLNDTQLIGMTPNIKINWYADDDDKVSFPVGLGTIGMFKVGKVPVRWGVEVQYYLTQPDDLASKWNFRVFLAPIALNPFK